MSIDELPTSLRISGRSSEEDTDHPGLLVKEGTGDEGFQLTDSVTDRVLGYLTMGVRSGQYESVKTAQGAVVLLKNDGSVSQGDRLAPSGSGGAKAGYVKSSEDVTETFVGYALQAANDDEEVQVLVLANVDAPNRSLTVDTGAEDDVVSNAFDVDLTQNLAAADDWLVEVYDDNMDPSSNIQITSQGSGSLQTAASQDSAIARLHTDGTETLRFMDGSGTLSATVHVECTPLNGDGEVKQFDLTYS